MVNVAHPGVTNISIAGMGSFFFLPGISRGFIPFGLWTSGSPGAALVPITDVGAGERTADTQADVNTKVISSYDGATSLAITPGDIWFEDVHILPREKIEFGNIITQKQDSYEIYNAYRSTDVTISSIVDTVTPGIDLPNMAAPFVIEAGSSALDPTTTGNSGGTGLGTMVLLKIDALTEGLPVFDGTITFTAAAASEEVSLLLSGSRIVLFPFEYEAPTKETLAFLTDIIEALDGAEQRIALRKNPRQLFEVTYKLTNNDRQRMQALLMDWMDTAFGFPLWLEQERLTASVSVAGTVYQVQDTTGMDLRVGGLAVVLTDANTFDVITIDSLTSTTITSTDPSVNAYAVGTKIMPLRTAILRRAVSGKRYKEMEEFNCTFEVTDNTTGSLTGDTTPGVWSLHTDGRVLFDDCNVIGSDSMPTKFERRVHVIDNATGIVASSSTWDRNKRSSQKGIVAHNRAEIISLRKLLQALQGRVVAFWIPTFIDDITASAALGSGAATMDINRIEYARFITERLPKSLFRITFTDDTSLIRTVISSADHPSDAAQERLTLDTTWPSARTVDEISRIEFYELSRFDTDTFRLDYPRIGLATLVAPVKQVFDDNA